MDIMIDKLRQYIIAKQKPDGSIYGEVDFNVWPCAAYLLLLEHLGIHRERKDDLIKWIISHQNEDGSWGFITDKSLGDYDNTLMGLAAVEAYMDRDKAERAKEWVQTFSCNKQLDPYTELILSINTEKIKISFPIAMALIPLFIPEKFGRLLGKLHMKFPKAFFWSTSFYPSVWTRGVLISFQIMSILKNRKNLGHIHKKAVKCAEKRLTELQLENGSWYGNVLSTLGPIYALHELGYSTNSVPIFKGLQFLDDLIGERGNLNMFQLTVWETSLAVMALVESGIPTDDRAIIKAEEFLLKAQTSAGGWAFDLFNQPDNDDTALAVLALIQVRKRNAIERGIKFLIKMQNDDGGWSAFDRNQSYKNPKRILSNPEFMDPSTPDVTGHVLQALGEVKGLSTSSKIIRKAIRWLIKDQNECGAWLGRWGICYIYGTSQVLHGLKAVQEDLHSDYVLKAINWLKEIQNPDGGWGEHYRSCYSDTPVLSHSTVEQTSWAMSALIDVGIEVDSEITETIKKGVAFLSKCQREDGSFPSAYTASTTYPAKYESYSVIFPLLALSKFQKRIGGS